MNAQPESHDGSIFSDEEIKGIREALVVSNVASRHAFTTMKHSTSMKLSAC